MMTQLPMFATKADEKFLAFHTGNPRVYQMLVEMTTDLVKRGHSKVGIKMLFEVIRWRRMLETTDPDYKLNNNYHSRYARLIMEQEPSLKGVFELRRLTT